MSMTRMCTPTALVSTTGRAADPSREALGSDRGSYLPPGVLPPIRAAQGTVMEVLQERAVLLIVG